MQSSSLCELLCAKNITCSQVFSAILGPFILPLNLVATNETFFGFSGWVWIHIVWFFSKSQMLHVWNIYLHLPQKWPNVGKYCIHGASGNDHPHKFVFTGGFLSIHSGVGCHQDALGWSSVKFTEFSRGNLGCPWQFLLQKPGKSRKFPDLLGMRRTWLIINEATAPYSHTRWGS